MKGIVSNIELEPDATVGELKTKKGSAIIHRRAL